MPKQLGMFDNAEGMTSPQWTHLPLSVRQELIELFASLLAQAVRPPPSIEEAADETSED